MTTITVKITELAGNHPDGFKSSDFCSAFKDKITETLQSNHPGASILVYVDMQKNVSGCTPEPLICATGFSDDYDIERSVSDTVGFLCQTFGENCVQDPAFYD